MRKCRLFSFQLDLVCDSIGRCQINIFTRQICSACRLAKCFSVGMKVELIRSVFKKNKVAAAEQRNSSAGRRTTTQQVEKNSFRRMRKSFCVSVKHSQFAPVGSFRLKQKSMGTSVKSDSLLRREQRNFSDAKLHKRTTEFTVENAFS